MLVASTPSLALAVLAVLLAGCGPGAGGDTSGSGDDSSASEPTGGGFDGVIVVREDSYLPAAGAAVVQPADPIGEDLDMTIVAGGEVFLGAYDDAGARSFAGVPEGPYLLRRDLAPNPDLPGTPGNQVYTATSLRTLDRGASYAGRADLATTHVPGTSLTLTVLDMQPLQASDTFELYSHDADALVFPSPGDGGPLVDDIAISDWNIAWDTSTVFTARDATPLVDPARGDTLRLTHLVTEPLVPGATDLGDPWSYALVERVLESAALTVTPMSAGAGATANGAFDPVATKTVALDLRPGAFLGELASFAAPTIAFCLASIYLEPGVELPVLGMTPTLATLSLEAASPLDPACFPDSLGECDPVLCVDGCVTDTAPTTPGDRVVELGYGNPYGPGSESITFQCSASVLVSHPKTGDSELLTVDIFTNQRLADLGGPLVPTLGPPGDLRVNGESAAADGVTKVGLSPTISFSAPTLGAPDHYTVVVRTLEDVLDGEGNILSRRRTIASVQTEDTSVQIPAGVLETGAYYYFQVVAATGTELASTRRAYSHTAAGARTATGIVTP